MILIIESGSTKSDWVLVENGEIANSYKTMGFNPFFHNETIIFNSIRQNSDLRKIAKTVSQVFFYGAGCSSVELNSIVQKAFSRFFINATINVDHDLLACALATYQGEPSISCILGTGSNSCLFDGENLLEAVPALGYILGDEGSGSYYGKKLLADYLYNKLPIKIKTDFESTFKFEKSNIFDNVYMKPHANVFLASFMRFIAKYKEHDYVDSMLKNGMKHFLENHVCCFENHKELKVHFIGSMSYIFQEQLKFAANELNISLGSIIKNPIDSLVSYHISNPVII
jgi:N-acetylglucosamine kinase-like BadF-type ATPase